MAAWKQKVNFEITPISGALRVSIRAEPYLLGAVLQAAIVSVVVWMASRTFLSLPRFQQGFLALAVGSAVAGIAQMLRRSEHTVEFTSEKLRIKRLFLGLPRTSEYAVDKCSDLAWRVPDDESGCTLECKVGFRKVKFGANVSEQQAQEILAALQRHLPDVAKRMGMSLENQESPFVRLGLT